MRKMRRGIKWMVPAMGLALTLGFGAGRAEAASFAETGKNYTLSDDGVLTVTGNAFTWEDVSQDNRKLVYKMVFSKNINTVRSDMTADRYNDQTISRQYPNLKTIVVESGVTTIGNSAFRSLNVTDVKLPSTVDSIGACAFYDCDNITSISVPEKVTLIQDYCFAESDSLKKVTLSSETESIGDDAFYECPALDSVNIEKTKVNTIGAYAFCETESLQSITFPSTLSSLQNGAFKESGLKSVTIPAKVSEIPYEAFGYCLSLSSVSFPSGLTYIGEDSFRKCPIKEITFPAKLNTIGEEAFRDTSLSKITFLGKTPVTNIRYDAFTNVRGAKGYYPAGGDFNSLKENFTNGYYSDITWSATGSTTKAGWQKTGGKWWYRTANGGYLKSTWKQLSGKWYYFDGSGYMVTGWKKLSGKWYYFGNDGVMRNGWQKISSKWYYFKDGAMKTGWQKFSGKWYYFTTDGCMVTGSKKIGGKTYRFSSEGVCLNP